MSIFNPHILRNTLLLSLTGLLAIAVSAAPEYRPEKAKRALNTDQFSLSILKNNRVDIHLIDGFPVISGAYPSITTVEKGTRPLKVVYSKSSRVGIRNALGRGNGFQFTTDECDWVIATYPGQPFITVSLTYTHTGRKPIQVSALSPWDVGGKGQGALFAGHQGTRPAVLMGHSTATSAGGPLTHGEAEHSGHLAIWNPGTREALVAGFLGQEEHAGTIALGKPGDSDTAEFGRFQAQTTFDPPLTLAPGDTLKADLFYFSFGERDVAEALERYVDSTRKLAPYPVLSPQFYRGWHAGAQPDIEEQTIREVMAQLSGTARQRGWGHVHLGTAWMADPTTLTRDTTRFPQELSALTTHGHAQGLTVGLTIPVGITTPAATQAFIQQCQADGFDSIELAAAPTADGQLALRALYETLGPSETQDPVPTLVYPVAHPPLPFSAIGSASRSYYLPVSGHPALNLSGTRHEVHLEGLNDEQFITEVTRAALLRRPLRTATPYSGLSPFRQAVLGRVPLATTQPAQPVDLLGERPPEAWYLPLKSSSGVWTITGLFNWSAAPGHVIQMPLERLGLNQGVRYTVYDYWAGQYLGLIKDTLKVEVPADGVRLLGLRYAEQHPMLVASNRDYTQGARDQGEITWDHTSQTLSGTMEGMPDFLHLLTFYVPEPYVLKSVEVSEEVLTQDSDGPSLKIGFKPSLRGEIRWSLSF